MNVVAARLARAIAPTRRVLTTTLSARHPFPKHAINPHTFPRTYATDAGFTDSHLLAQQAQESMSRGASALTQGNAPAALPYLEHALRLHPTADTHYNMGICRYMLNDVDQAIEHWQMSVTMDPTQADAYVSLGNAYFLSKKDTKRAIEFMTKAMELAPKDPEIQFNLACVHESAGDLESAIMLYDRAVSYGLEKAQAYLRNAIAKQMKKNL
ncbi:hypothetical protein IWW50_002920 [Coemansia erecta]|nr:hypothetical protein GGF43_001756 [Coemansia sp. RSA 2618]KAJ2825291.1 hypothetical protein IWW50_002920 [Coemansia erecta]